MLLRSYIYATLIVLPLLYCTGETTAALPGQSSGDPEQKAISLFDEGRYKEALSVFEDLIRLYPEDKTLNYYLGASLIETKNYGTRARQALLNSVGKDIPEKIDYYLGIAFHAENDYLTALDYYRRFEKQAKNKIKKSVNYQNLIDLCEQGNNPFVAKEEVVKTILTTSPIDTVAITAVPDTIPPSGVAEFVPSFVIPKELFDSIIVFQINTEIQYRKICQFRNAEARENFARGWIKKQEMDSIVFLTNDLRKQYPIEETNSKQILSEQILANEQKIISINKAISEYKLLAEQIEREHWKSPSYEEIEKLLAENKAITDSLDAIQAKSRPEISDLPPVSISLPIAEKVEEKEETTNNKGILYRVQIGAFSKAPPDWMQRLYDRLSLIRKINTYTDENGVTVYTTGEVRSYDDAVELQKQVKLEGIRDASIAAYKDGIRIPPGEARKINGE